MSMQMPYGVACPCGSGRKPFRADSGKRPRSLPVQHGGRVAEAVRLHAHQTRHLRTRSPAGGVQATGIRISPRSTTWEKSPHRAISRERLMSDDRASWFGMQSSRHLQNRLEPRSPELRQNSQPSRSIKFWQLSRTYSQTGLVGPRTGP